MEIHIVDEKKIGKMVSDESIQRLKEKFELKIKKKIVKFEQEISENWEVQCGKIMNDEIQSLVIENGREIEKIIEKSTGSLYQDLKEFQKKAVTENLPFNVFPQFDLDEVIESKLSQCQFQTSLKIESKIEETIQYQISSGLNELKSDLSKSLHSSFSKFFSSISSEVVQNLDFPSEGVFLSLVPEKEPNPIKKFVGFESRPKSNSVLPQFSAGNLLQKFLSTKV